MKLAIFDIDGTLVDGTSERLFWRYLVSRGRQGPRQAAAYLLFLVRYLPTGGIHTTKKNKAYLAGLGVDEVASLAQDFVAQRLVHRLFEPVVARLEAHRARGDAVVLISGTLQCVARALAERLEVQHVCATIASQRNGLYLAQPPEVHPFDSAKLSLARELATELGADLGEAAAYGDSGHDIALLSAVAEPVAVRPDAALLREAVRRDWEVICERPLASTMSS